MEYVQKRKILAVSIVVLLVGIVVSGLTLLMLANRNNSTRTSTLVLEVVPSDSQITVDSKRVKQGNIKVAPGEHTVTFSRNGFETVTKTVVVDDGESVYAGESLNPNSPDTQDWYSTHPDEAAKSEGITGKNYDQFSSDMTEDNSIVTDLPVVESTFRIDYGESRQSPEDPKSLGIYIRAISQQGRDDALDWLHTFGYNPDDYEIIYINPNEE